MEYEAHNIKARHYLCGDVDVIEIKGEMTAFAEGILFDVIRPLLREGRRLFVLDLAGMTYVNSSGMGLFVHLFLTVNRGQGRIAFVTASPKRTEQFAITRIDDFVPIFPTVSEAIVALQKMPMPPPSLGQ